MQIWFFERNFLSRLKERRCDVACTVFLLLSFQLLPKGMDGVIMAEATSQDTEGEFAVKLTSVWDGGTDTEEGWAAPLLGHRGWVNKMCNFKGDCLCASHENISDPSSLSARLFKTTEESMLFCASVRLCGQMMDKQMQ